MNPIKTVPIVIDIRIYPQSIILEFANSNKISDRSYSNSNEMLAHLSEIMQGFVYGDLDYSLSCKWGKPVAELICMLQKKLKYIMSNSQDREQMLAETNEVFMRTLREEFLPILRQYCEIK